MPYRSSKGKEQKGVYESVPKMGGGKVKKSSKPSKKMSGGKRKHTQGY